jgi:hypothetical protein
MPFNSQNQPLIEIRSQCFDSSERVPLPHQDLELINTPISDR